MIDIEADPKIPSGKTYWVTILQFMQDIDQGMTGGIVRFVFFLRDQKLLKSEMLRALAKSAANGDERQSWKLLHQFMENNNMKPDRLENLAAKVQALPPAPEPKKGIACYGKVEWVDGKDS